MRTRKTRLKSFSLAFFFLLLLLRSRCVTFKIPAFFETSSAATTTTMASKDIADFIQSLFYEIKYRAPKGDGVYKVTVNGHEYNMVSDNEKRVIIAMLAGDEEGMTELCISEEEPDEEGIRALFGLTPDCDFAPRFREESYWRTTSYASKHPADWATMPEVYTHTGVGGTILYRVKRTAHGRYGIMFTPAVRAGYKMKAIIDPNLPEMEITNTSNVKYREVEWQTIAIWQSPF